MEGRACTLSKELITKPKKLKTPHFSRPTNSFLIAVREEKKATKTQERTIRFSTSSRQKAGAKPPKKLSQTPTAIRKRKSRSDKNIRDAENIRRNAANKLKRKDPAHQQRLAALREKRKIAKQSLLEVNTAASALQPFGSIDEIHGVYEIEKWSEIQITNYEKHRFTKGKVASNSISNSNISSNLVSIDIENKSLKQARTVTPL